MTGPSDKPSASSTTGNEGNANATTTRDTTPENNWQTERLALPDDPLLVCLLDAIRILGEPRSAEALVAGLPLENNRITPSLVPRAAARAQCNARLVRRRIQDIPETLLPAILLLDDRRACLLLEAGRKTCTVQFPETGTPTQIATKELEADYSGHTFFIHPQHGPERGTQPTEKKEAGGHWFWRAVAANSRLYRDALVAACLINVFALAIPLFSLNVYDRVVPNNAVETLWVMVAGVILVILFDMVLSVARSHVLDTASKRIDVNLSSRIMEQILDLRLENRPSSVGAFAANLRSFEAVRDFIASATLTALIDVPFSILFLAILAWISPYMMIPPVVAILIMLLLASAAQWRLRELVGDSFDATAQRNGVLVESLGGLETIKTLNAQGQSQRTWEQSTRYLAFNGSRTRFTTSLAVNAFQAIQRVVSVVVVVIGVYLAQSGQLTVGGIIAASMIAGRCLVPFGKVASLMMQYQNARASLKSIDSYMALPVEHDRSRTYIQRHSFMGELEFRSVSFTYPGARQPALRNISFKIQPGEKVGIIGRVGSGKTTLEKLILGLYSPTQGVVLLDGIDISQIDPSDLRRTIGHVPQDPVLFRGTLKHNLTLGAPHATDADILRVAAIAGIGELADSHPDGYDMQIGERGDSVSGGQRQSIAIARGLLHDPPIILLDEPSSNMDNQGEGLLKQRLARACEGKTMILVTHRTALLGMVDRLIVMDQGRIVADGPKAQVVEALRSGQISRVGGQ